MTKRFFNRGIFKRLLLGLLPPLLLILFSVTVVFAETRTKTVQFFVGQNASSGGAMSWTSSFNVYLPDAISSATVIKSAYVDYTFQTGVAIAAGVATLGVKLTSEGTYTTATSASFTSSGENFTHKIRANFLSKFRSAIQSSGTYNFDFSGAISGTTQKGANAKLVITYDYDSTAATQLTTARFYGGMLGTTLPVGTSATFTLSPSRLWLVSVFLPIMSIINT